MNLNRWASIILMMSLILALNPMGAQAGPKCHHPSGHAYGWDGPGPHGFDRHYKKHFRHHGKGRYHSHHYVAGPPQVAYVAPVTPVIGIPYSQPQPYYSQPPVPGLSGNLNWNF